MRICCAQCSRLHPNIPSLLFCFGRSSVLLPWLLPVFVWRWNMLDYCKNCETASTFREKKKKKFVNAFCSRGHQFQRFMMLSSWTLQLLLLSSSLFSFWCSFSKLGCARLYYILSANNITNESFCKPLVAYGKTQTTSKRCLPKQCQIKGEREWGGVCGRSPSSGVWLLLTSPISLSPACAQPSAHGHVCTLFLKPFY